ncbi:diaminopimelate epimerase [Streptomyces sp. NPDC002055]|uniref:diaminopimelate epimerase n=1 Tax=Streptomyces sp. NPDC002055 TaxID=3154534 RepID=UPI0033338ED5
MLNFRKVHGAGNDFILFTGSAADLDRDWSQTARELCARHTGVGADGLVISAPLAADVRGVACFNADGSIATMCGNALRCAAWCAAEDSESPVRELRLVMAGVEHRALVAEDGVWVTAEVGPVEPRRVQAVLNGRPFWFDSAHTGTEHVVAVVTDVEDIDTEAYGRLVRAHPGLAPLGANVNFIQAAGVQELKIRTYERGVEAETLSCGSGAVAAVVVAILRGLVADRQVIVHNRSGTPLMVRPCSERRGKTFWVGGPVAQTYRGALV